MGCFCLLKGGVDLDDRNMNRLLMQQAAKKFGSHEVLYSKYVPKIPASAEREYVRLTDDYMRILKEELERELPKLKDVYRENREADIREKRRTDGVIDTFLMAAVRIFRIIRNRVSDRVSRYQLQKRMERLAQLNLRLTIKEWNRAVKSTLGIDIREDYYLGAFYSDQLDKWVLDNVGLIKTIPEDTLDKMCDIVYDGFTRGKTTTRMVKEIQQTYGVSRRRAELIARDQTAKLNGQIQQAQQMDAGITEYIWYTCMDSRVRDRHRELHGKKFRWDDPPVVDEKSGRRCHPGQDYQCRCIARPVFNRSTLNLPVAGEGDGMHRSGMNAGSSTGAESRDRFGIITNNNRGDPRYYDFAGKDLRLVENELSQRNFETAVCFDENGKAVFAQLGNEDTIVFTKVQQRQMKGGVLTHNHPLGTPPSPEDLYVLKKNHLKELRTCGRNGTYVLRYSKKVEALPDFDTLNAFYDAVLKGKRSKYKERVSNGVSAETAIIELGEEIWEEIYKKYGVKPVFERG